MVELYHHNVLTILADQSLPHHEPHNFDYPPTPSGFQQRTWFEFSLNKPSKSLLRHPLSPKKMPFHLPNNLPCMWSAGNRH
jgi:hypothetical protein